MPKSPGSRSPDSWPMEVAIPETTDSFIAIYFYELPVAAAAAAEQARHVRVENVSWMKYVTLYIWYIPGSQDQ